MYVYIYIYMYYAILIESPPEKRRRTRGKTGFQSTKFGGEGQFIIITIITIIMILIILIITHIEIMIIVQIIVSPAGSRGKDQQLSASVADWLRTNGVGQH